MKDASDSASVLLDGSDKSETRVWSSFLTSRRVDWQANRAGQANKVNQANRAGLSPLFWSAILGCVSLWLIMIGTSINSSPFTLHASGSWFFSTGPATNNEMFLSLVMVYGGLLLFLRVWIDLIRWLEESPGLPVAKLIPVFALWVIPMLIVPPLFSKDVYSYAAQGEMVSHGISPYSYGPGILGGTKFLNLADPLWQNAPTPYGPLVLGMDGWIVNLTGHSVLGTVVIMRILAFAGVISAAVFIPRIARHFGRDGAVGFAFAILNPVTLFHLIGGSHNDAIMIGLLVPGIWFALDKKPIWGIFLCTLAAAVKAPAELAVVYIGWNWVDAKVPLRSRFRPILTAGVISGAIMAFISWATGLGWGWLGALGTPGTVVSLISPTTLVGTILGKIAGLVGLGASQQFLLSFSRAVGLLVAFSLCIVILRFSDRLGSVRALGVSLLIVVLLGPVVQPWYLSWGLILTAAVASGKLRKVVMFLSIAVCFIGLPGATDLLHFLLHANLLSILTSLGILVLVLTTPLKGWVRRLMSWRATALN